MENLSIKHDNLTQNCPKFNGKYLTFSFDLETGKIEEKDQL